MAQKVNSALIFSAIFVLFLVASYSGTRFTIQSRDYILIHTTFCNIPRRLNNDYIINAYQFAGTFEPICDSGSSMHSVVDLRCYTFSDRNYHN